jgi:hypothetical protein
MSTKTRFGLFTALFILFGLMSAQAQSVVHNKAYYDAITYEWTDAAGANHTNAITDLATDPYQIVALLKKVYCDPNIPGPLKSAYKENGERERDVHYGAIEGGWNISDEDVIPPYEEGYTLLMVAVKDELNLVGSDTRQQTGTSGWLNPQPTYGTFMSNFFTQPSELINYIGDNVASVQLLTDGLRIGENLEIGTVFNISGTYNRFFILGKGQAREKDEWVIQQQNSYSPYKIIAGERVPFKEMFEEFSPTSGLAGSEITDFYASMVKGDIYGVIHDCASVIEVEHYFSMAGKNNTDPRSLTGLNIFIPDYRLLYWVDQYKYRTYRINWMGDTIWTEHGPYDVDGRTLNPYKTITGADIFSSTNSRSYLCANYGNYNPAHAPRVGIYMITLDADATPAAEAKTFDVVLDWTSSLDQMSGSAVPQNYIVYIIATDEYGNETLVEVVQTTDSYYTYTVPQNEHSYTITYIVFGQPADGEHDAFVAWSNTDDVIIPGWNDFLSLTLNHYESDYVSSEQNNYYRNFLNPENMDMLNALTVERVAAGENSFTLYRFDANNPDAMIPVAVLTLIPGNNGVRYTIEYENQVPLADYNINVVTSGNLNVDNNGAIDLNDIMFVDQFNANTANNDHPSRYGYMLALNGETNKTTNTVEVPVFKTNSTIDGYYTLEEVMADVDAELPTNVKNANVEMSLSNNPAIYYYTLERGDNTYPNEPISKLQRRTDGTYLEMLDVLPQYFNTEAQPGIVNRLDNLVEYGEPGDYMSYEPVIWTFGTDRVKQDGENSYGSPIYRTGVGAVTSHVIGTYSVTEFGEWKDEMGRKCCIYNPYIDLYGFVPTDASVDYEPFMYRVWRLCNTVRGYTIDPVTNKPVNDPDADRSPKALIVEEMSNEHMISLGSEFNGLEFGALTNSTIQFLVRFYYKKVGENGIRDNSVPMYYVVDQLVNWTEMRTAVNEINAIVEVGKTYYNAQGIESDKPFKGVNIVVTQYSDGSTKTSKIVK